MFVSTVPNSLEKAENRLDQDARFGTYTAKGVYLCPQFRVAWRKLLKLEMSEADCQAPASLTHLTGAVSPRATPKISEGTGKSEQPRETSM